MALRELPSALRRLGGRDAKSRTMIILRNSRRHASGEASPSKEVLEDIQDLESQSSFSSSAFEPERIKAFDPVKKSQGRRRELPPSRYARNYN